MSDIVVFKFGGSVLCDDESYRRAAAAVRDEVARKKKVVVVVSARFGATDQLSAEAAALAAHPDPKARDLLLATGELASVARLGIALIGLGVSTETANPWQLGIDTDGRFGAAEIESENPWVLLARLAEKDAIVCPGFLGKSADGSVTTLGRGGSDLTAVALAESLGAEACVFWKDVPGYFSADPHVVEGAVHRPIVTIAEAAELARHGCRYLQDRALERAANGKTPILLRAFDDPRASVLVKRRQVPESLPLVVTHRLDGRSPIGTVTVVGEGFHEARPHLAEAGRAHLLSHGIAATIDSTGPHRVTYAVAAGELAAAERLLHAVILPARVGETAA